MRVKLFILLCVTMLLVGCSTTNIVQIAGQPVHSNIISASVFDPEMKLVYYLEKSYKVYEGKEFYEDREYLPFEETHYIKDDETLSVNLTIFNPNKGNIKVIQVINNDDKITKYSGKLSRKIIDFDLPKLTGDVEYFFNITDEEDTIVYQSFRVSYRYIRKDTTNHRNSNLLE